ncbi:hypothetical protein D9V84_06620 [Bacteroidetes/Chlorobi group bacterium Naka2016]|jgi:chemotaxis regulatin CheY-phosphate phosphatase CheZ|nr:MAG: hypothetical protein D9V84_06620 [Bacteroidetes/Chlorobi group bacterium Naka2016]
MKELDIKELLRKADELKALFVLGQRVIPFLEELFSFVGEIQPLLEEINKSIKENLSKMPNLSKQLSKVTEATELATNEILDIIDGIFYKLDILASGVDTIENEIGNVDKFITEFNQILKSKENQELNSDEFISKVSKLFENFKFEFHKELNFGNFKEIIENIRADSTSIMLALQVQDITSQQIAAVNHLLNTVQNKLGTLIQKFESSDVHKVVSEAAETVNVTKLHREVAFDPDAVETLVGNTTKQDEIDKIFEQGLSIEQDNIVNRRPKEVSSNPTNVVDESDTISQSDIDALFAQSDTDK